MSKSLHATRWKYRTQKIAILAPSHNFVGLYLWNYGMYRQSEKCLKKQYLPLCPDNMVNFGLLTAEIRWRLWGTPANFNVFLVFAAVLHITLVVGVSQTLRRWTEEPPVFGRVAITLGIGPHSSYLMFLIAWSSSIPGEIPKQLHSCHMLLSMGKWQILTPTEPTTLNQLPKIYLLQLITSVRPTAAKFRENTPVGAPVEIVNYNENLLWPPCGIGQAIIFLPNDFYLLSSSFFLA